MTDDDRSEDRQGRDDPARNGGTSGSPAEPVESDPGDGPWRDVPLADLAEEVQSDWRENVTDLAAEAFIHVEMDEIDRDAIWAEIEESVETRFDPPDEPEERVVPKQPFCHRCRYFSSPPDVRCTHEGTEIVEMVDLDHYRVSNCPIVQEYERAGRSW